MRTIIGLVLIYALVATSAMAQTKETRDVSTFTEVSYRVSGKLYLRQGSPQKVVLEGDSEDIREIETEVKGNRLIIRNPEENGWFSWRNDSKRRVNVYITMENVDALFVSGSGDLYAETTIKTGHLELKVTGSGDMELQADQTGDLHADVSGSGNLKVKGKCRDLYSSVSGSGKVYIAHAIAGTAKFSMSGSGKVLAAGKAQVVKADISGSGKLLAADMEADRCDVRITGSGDVEINVKSELDARITGSGSVSYKGSPNHVNSNSSGSGKIRKMG